MAVNGSAWTEAASAVATSLALFVSMLSLLVSYFALKIARRQEDRKNPALRVSLLDSYVQFLCAQKGRAYAFLISVSNLSDADNALARVDLRLSYTASEDEPLITVLVPANRARKQAFSGVADFPLLQAPSRIDAYQTLTGWCIFEAPQAILNGRAIDRQAVVLTDSHGNEESIEAIVIREYVDEAFPAIQEAAGGQ